MKMGGNSNIFGEQKELESLLKETVNIMYWPCLNYSRTALNLDIY
jgi:hypothetical protein